MPDILLDGWLDCFHAGTRGLQERKPSRKPARKKSSNLSCWLSGMLSVWQESLSLRNYPLRRSGEVSVSFFQCGFHDARADELSQSDG